MNAETILLLIRGLPHPGACRRGSAPPQRTAICALIALTISTQHVRAQEFNAQQRGRNLARQVCSECHAIGPRESLSPNSYAPSFVAIASTPGMTEAALNFVLHTSHRRMPNIILNSGQTNAIIAYIQSLKK